MFTAKDAIKWLKENLSSVGSDSQYMAAFSMPDGKCLGLQRASENAKSFTLWLESFEHPVSGVTVIKKYAAEKTRHSALNTKRLSRLNVGNPIVHVSVDSVIALSALVQAYGSSSMSAIDIFLEKYANQTLRSFVEKLPEQEVTSLIHSYETIRAAFPKADIYTTSSAGSLSDLRIGVREKERIKGKPYFYIYRGYGSLFMNENPKRCTDIGKKKHILQVDLVQGDNNEMEGWINKQKNRYGAVINGQGLNPKDYACDAIEPMERDMLSPLNQILYGPPGTGKTYNTAVKALEILDPEYLAECAGDYDRIRARYDVLAEQERIGFVTFHQSFSYEDFVEGIKAETEDGKVQYTLEDGVFKKMCELARSRAVTAEGGIEDFQSRKIWKLSLGSPSRGEGHIFEECIQNGYALLGWGGSIDFINCNDWSQIRDKFDTDATWSDHESLSFATGAVNTFKNTISKGDLVVVSDGNLKYRAIGEVTGDYYLLDNTTSAAQSGFRQCRNVTWLREYSPSRPTEELFKKNFSMQSIYELRSGIIKREVLQQLLSETGTEAIEDKPYVLIVDEINRGNISRIFGELITLLEPTKRAGSDEALTVTLPYSKEKFSVPANLYVIGTMNTADRSLAQLDIALRRRFEFVEMMPNHYLLNTVEVGGISIGTLLQTLNERIEVLLDRDHTLGHSYFLPLAKDGANTLENLARIFEKQILPLLQEYFFEDWQRIQWVLNDHQKPEQYQFIRQGGATDLVSLFGHEVSNQVNDRRWFINTHAFKLQESYLYTIRKREVAVPLPEETA